MENHHEFNYLFETVLATSQLELSHSESFTEEQIKKLKEITKLDFLFESLYHNSVFIIIANQDEYTELLKTHTLERVPSYPRKLF
jgi:hypothetical protein